MKKLLLISVLTLFATGVMFGQTSVDLGSAANSNKQSLEAALGTTDVSSIESLTIKGEMNDADIAYMRTLKDNLVTLDMAGVTFVPDLYKEGDEIPEGKEIGSPKKTFITDAHDRDWTMPLKELDGTYHSYGIQAADHLPSHIFDGMTSLVTVTLPSSVTVFESFCFMGCTNLQNVNGIDQVTDLGRYAFLDCTSMESFIIPDKVTKFVGTFQDCTSLTTVTFPSNENVKFTHIGASAFARCTSLDNVTVPSNVTEIEQYAFFGCTGMTTITLPTTGIKKFDTYCFGECENITSTVTLCDALTEVAYGAFSGCKKMNFTAEGTTMLPAGLAFIGDLAFTSCENFKSDIIYPAQTDGIIHEGVFWGSGVTAVKIPSGITEIKAHAFEKAKLGEGHTDYKLEFPSSVTFIGYGSFAHNHGVTSIDIKGSDAGSSRDLVIDAWCFHNLSAVKSMTIGENIANISFGEKAFWQNRVMEYFTIPSNATVTVGMESFAENEKLARVDMGEGAQITEILKGGFAGCVSLPDAEVNNDLIPNVTTLHEGVFKNCTGLEHIVIPSRVNWIFNDAFGGDDNHVVNLKSITVSRNEAPSIGYVDGTYTVGNEEQMKTEHPFGPEVVANPNMCEIRFTGDADDDESVKSYRANPKFMEIMTKTMNENDVTYNCVPQRGADVLLTRTMKSKWNSVVLPFAVSQVQLEQTFGPDSKAANFTSCVPAKEAFRFTVRDGIDPNSSVLVMPTKKHETDDNNDGVPDEPYHFVNVNVVGANVVAYPEGGNNGYIFTGTYNSDTANGTPSVSAGSYFVYDNHFFSNGVANYTKAFRGWLAPVSGAAPRLAQAMAIEIANEDGETTMIDSVQDFTDKQADHAYYTLDGRRVENPTNGIYIVNGKKVVIK